MYGLRGVPLFSPGSAIAGSELSAVLDEDLLTPSPVAPPLVPELVQGLPAIDKNLVDLFVALFKR